MRVAGSLAAKVLDMITDYVKPGISTGELDDLCREFIIHELRAIPANIGYKGFQHTICASLNNVICHGIPSHTKLLKEGDILNIDVTVIKDGWHGDTSKMFIVGKTQPHNERLVKITQECMYLGIKEVKPGARLGDIGAAIQNHAEKNYYSVVEDYCGHGIGKIYHEELFMINFSNTMPTVILYNGVVIFFSMILNCSTYVS